MVKNREARKESSSVLPLPEKRKTIPSHAPIRETYVVIGLYNSLVASSLLTLLLDIPCAAFDKKSSQSQKSLEHI